LANPYSPRPLPAKYHQRIWA